MIKGDRKKDKLWSFIAWAPYSRRSRAFANAFQGELHCIHYLRFQKPFYAPPKYLLQAARTLQVLFARCPEVVHVQNPPIFCSLVVGFYCSLTHAVYIVDHHSAAFGHTWDAFLMLQKHLARQAVTNIVTTQHWAEVIHSWGGHALIMGDPFLDLPQGEPISISERFNIVCVCTFSLDEPLEAVLKAVSGLPQIHLYVTGDINRKPRCFHDSLEPTVTYTGFLPDPQYIGLLRAADAIMVLTTRDHTLQLGGCEAVSLGQPLITSDWPCLRKFFSKGAIFVNNTCSSIRDGIVLMMREHAMLKREIEVLRFEKRQEWRQQAARLEEIVFQARSGAYKR